MLIHDAEPGTGISITYVSKLKAITDSTKNSFTVIDEGKDTGMFYSFTHRRRS